MQVRERSTKHPISWKQQTLRWLPTFLGFPLGGEAAKLISGPVDALAPALVGGAITGAIAGAIQAWAIGFDRPQAVRWIAGTAIGFMVGLGIGSSAVDYGTTMGDLAVQGAFTGVCVGAMQGIVLRRPLGRLAYAWPPALGALYAIGWSITTAAGIDVESQYTVFGSSGALVVTLATAVLPVTLAHRSNRSVS